MNLASFFRHPQVEMPAPSQPASTPPPAPQPESEAPIVATSVLSTIETDVKQIFVVAESDAAKFTSAFVKLFKKAPNALQTVENFTNEAAPVITAAVALADPAVEPAVAAALAIAETGLAALEASAQAATSGNSLLVNLQNFATTVPADLTALQIKNPILQAAVTRIVTLIVGEAKVLIPAVQSWIAQIQAASQPKAA